MTLLLAWVAFPLVLALVCAGNGLLLEQAAGFALPRPLLVPAGFVLVSLEGQFAILSAHTAQLSTPIAVAGAVAGVGLSLQRRRISVNLWPAIAALATFAVFAAPIVLSGRATFAGYIKLDDTATYLAMLDQAMHHGYSVAGLPPSTYEATLKTSLVLGYPLGSLLPLGIGRVLVAQDLAWLWQPYLAFLATILALGLYQLVQGLVARPRHRALVAFVGAQSALLYGYALWGGVKELATAALVVCLGSLVPITVDRLPSLRALLPLGAASAAVVGALSLGGAVWLAPLLLGVVVLVFRRHGAGATLRAAGGFLVAACVFAIPAFVEGRTWLSHSSAFTGGTELGNLIRRLDWLQLFGVWLSGDFRRHPASLDTTYVFVGVVALAAVAGGVFAWRVAAWELLLVVLTGAVAAAVYFGLASPWIGSKALASASPIVLTLALAAVAAVFESGRRVEGLVAAGVVVAGVLWSNGLQYREAYLAPSGRLSDLATIGHRFAGEGPTLLTDFDPYGARHFLRNMQTEATSELRRSEVFLRAGGVADTGSSPDLDEIQLASVLYYRTIVLRRSGSASRPPSNYVPVYQGSYYDVWQRNDSANQIVEHDSLGSRLQPAAVPACSEVLRLGRIAAANNGLIAAVQRPPATVIETDGTVRTPTSFGSYGEDPSALYLRSAYSSDARFTAPAAGTFGVWIGGSFRAGVTISIDGRRVGAAHDELGWPGTLFPLGSARLAGGNHTLRLSYSGPDYRPGSAGLPPFGLGPIVVSQATDDTPVTYVQPADARTLCGKSLDWIEALRG